MSYTSGTFSSVAETHGLLENFGRFFKELFSIIPSIFVVFVVNTYSRLSVEVAEALGDLADAYDDTNQLPSRLVRVGSTMCAVCFRSHLNRRVLYI